MEAIPTMKTLNSRTSLALSFATFAALSVAPALARASTWEIDGAHSSAQFSVRHLMVSNVRGEFGSVKGTVNLDDKDVTKSSVDATIDVSSITTRNTDRDNHLKSPDFFDVAKFPTMTFKSTAIQKQADGKLNVTGNLSLHGTTKPVTLSVALAPEVKDPWGKTRRGAEATGKINRKDFGLSWNKALETGGVAVGEEVSITIDLEITQKGAAQPAK